MELISAVALRIVTHLSSKDVDCDAQTFPSSDERKRNH